MPHSRTLFLLLLFLIPAAAALLHRLSQSTRWHTLRTLFFLLLFSELFKHASALALGRYHSGLFPFHYSTTFYLSCALYLFFKGRAAHFGACTLFVGGSFLTLAIAADPCAVLGDPRALLRDYNVFHSLFYHVGVLVIFASMLRERAYRVQKGDTWRYLCHLLCWSAIALPAARRFSCNYAGLLRSYLPVLERVRLAAGDSAYLALYFLLALLAARLLLLLWQRFAPPLDNSDAIHYN